MAVDFTRLEKNDPEVTPKYLTFTGGASGNWSTAQSVSLKFLAEPTAATSRVAIEGTGGSKTYEVDVGAYRRTHALSSAGITIAAGSTTGTATFTARNDYNDFADHAELLALATHPTASDWISKGTGADPSITITDDDELGQVTGVSVVQATDALGNPTGGATVSWTKVTGATGYTIEWKTGTEIYDSSRRLTAGDVATYVVPDSYLTPGTTYDIRVYATKSGADRGLPSDEVEATYTGWLVFTPTSLTVAEPKTGTATGTYTVKLSGQPNAAVTVTLARGAGSTNSALTFSPSTLTFTTTDWNTAQTVTVTSAPDTDGVDDVLVVTHTAASTGADFSGVTASLAATETDNNSAPESESFTVYVKPKSSATRTRTLVSDFPFKDDDTDRLAYVIIETLPAAAQGALKLRKTWRLCRSNCVSPVTSSVTWSPSALMFSTQNWNTAQTAHVTLPAKPAADVTVTLGQSGVTFTPSTLTFTPTNWNTAQPVAVKLSSQPQVTDKLNLPALTRLTHLDTTYVWSPTELTFNTSNWTTWQSATIKMSEQPETDVTVTLAEAGVEFKPSTLTFTPSDWNNPKTVEIRRTGAPQVYLALTSGRNVPNDQWQGSRFRQVMEFYPTDAFSSATFTFRVEDWAGNISDDVYTATLLLEGTAPAAVTGFAAAAGNGEVTLSWDDPNDSTITHYEYRWRRYKGSHEWSTWETVTTPVTPDPATLNFTTTDYGTGQDGHRQARRAARRRRHRAARGGRRRRERRGERRVHARDADLHDRQLGRGAERHQREVHAGARRRHHHHHRRRHRRRDGLHEDRADQRHGVRVPGAGREPRRPQPALGAAQRQRDAEGAGRAEHAVGPRGGGRRQTAWR